MRKLTSQELQWVHTKLKSLHIRYTEVYEEIFDHYCTTLENASEAESNGVFERLNKTFAWSVVKRMDKNRRKASNQQLTKLQLESLKFWKLKAFNLLILFFTLTSALFISYWFGTYAFISCVGIVGFIAGIIMFSKHRTALNFSFNPFKEKPVNSFSHVIYGRFCLFIPAIINCYIGLTSFQIGRLSMGSQFFTLINIAFILLFIFGLSLIKATLDYQVPKLQLGENL